MEFSSEQAHTCVLAGAQIVHSVLQAVVESTRQSGVGRSGARPSLECHKRLLWQNIFVFKFCLTPSDKVLFSVGCAKLGVVGKSVESLAFGRRPSVCRDPKGFCERRSGAGRRGRVLRENTNVESDVAAEEAVQRSEVRSGQQSKDHAQGEHVAVFESHQIAPFLNPHKPRVSITCSEANVWLVSAEKLRVQVDGSGGARHERERRAALPPRDAAAPAEGLHRQHSR